ncbi:MAG TPA: hypothetical protein VGV07_21935 [Devosia sp.]|jgi:hypothetical protein|uniref:hypothetical protein n=1 Tax=Devosia sp. TaxID=1871048 RepID=UPI002DDCEA3F|nr:hypothetical protein [Devosia sp.]HEV2517928.1 hypothetical protein [Devosia sp.]
MKLEQFVRVPLSGAGLRYAHPSRLAVMGWPGPPGVKNHYGVVVRVAVPQVAGFRLLPKGMAVRGEAAQHHLASAILGGNRAPGEVAETHLLTSCAARSAFWRYCGTASDDLSSVFLPEGGMSLDNSEVRKVLVDLLRIARVAMPPHLQAQDIRLIAAEQMIAALDAEPDADIVEGLNLFLQEDFAPASRSEAIAAILRDWLVGHGYLQPAPAIEERH